MNIIDTSSSSFIANEEEAIKNIPLFKIRPINYLLPESVFTDVIFQSTASVKNFKNFEICNKKNIYAMGQSTKFILSRYGVESRCPAPPGSDALTSLLGKNLKGRKFLIIKGIDGLNKIKEFIDENMAFSEEIICYERIELNNYNDLKSEFEYASAVIFTSVLSAKMYFKNIHSEDNDVALFSISKRVKREISQMGYESKIIDYFSDSLLDDIKKAI
tara:strand:+ start:19 stop:669 length:651 start_codon:yes stop_codon:yes gene_type:complete